MSEERWDGAERDRCREKRDETDKQHQPLIGLIVTLPRLSHSRPWASGLSPAGSTLLLRAPGRVIHVSPTRCYAFPILRSLVANKLSRAMRISALPRQGVPYGNSYAGLNW
ncbi:hypothetical protein Pa4123_04800 [Phytohabitans aurantiacus]|uniref:Uncharacterized protein n=1 Tax=Phytohabitans aurantiacus TaxID=3016789 RepID=A0ABQ5QLK7_9ACTN|nr:hypothetical protein Pa4123_04800 [Phytohabitans aurantiacus]